MAITEIKTGNAEEIIPNPKYPIHTNRSMTHRYGDGSSSKRLVFISLDSFGFFENADENNQFTNTF